MNRRQFALKATCALTALNPLARDLEAFGQSTSTTSAAGVFVTSGRRPPLSARTFTSTAVEELISSTKALIQNPQLATLFENCYPNTLDTTVLFSEHGGLPDTFLVTGDIPAMWLRDSSAQVHPYIDLARKDEKLKQFFRGLIHRQARCILIDSYANAFFATPDEKGQFATDLTEMRPGVYERKWEIDSLCYPIRLAYNYWRATEDSSPLDDQWHQAAHRIVATFREQQRLKSDGPYRFQRMATTFYDNSPNRGLGSPTRKIGLIHSAFRASDDACILPFLVPSNIFAVVSLRELAEISEKALGDEALAANARSLADELHAALQTHAVVNHLGYGDIYAYEIDGMGNALFMDDANIPSLLSLPYIGFCKADDPIYKRTRAFVLSEDNPFFFRGVAEGVGGPHVGPGMIWPLSIIMRALTSDDEAEIESCLRMLLDTTAGTGFMHESFDARDPRNYTRPWFAWCNSLFGELVLKIAGSHRAILNRI